MLFIKKRCKKGSSSRCICGLMMWDLCCFSLVLLSSSCFWTAFFEVIQRFLDDLDYSAAAFLEWRRLLGELQLSGTRTSAQLVEATEWQRRRSTSELRKPHKPFIGPLNPYKTI